MKKCILKIITVCLTAIIATNNFQINMKSASAAEIGFTETEDFEERLIYEHKNENGLIERVYLKNTPNNYTNSKNLPLTFKLYDDEGEIVRNEMYTAWTYGGAVSTYPYLAYYENKPSAINASSITYLKSSTTQGQENGLYFTMYQANFSYTYHGKPFTWVCSLTFYANGSHQSSGMS